MIRLADAHCHLDGSHFQEGPDAVLQRAREVGVVGFVVVAAKATPPLNAGAAGELSTRAIESTKLGTNIVVNLL